jgi:hypothetical protein
MAINSFSQGVTPSALPLPVTTASATTSATTTDVTVSWTPDSKGSVPTTYSIIGTATAGVTTTASTTSTSVTISKQSAGKAYSFAVTAQNRFGNSATATSSSAVTPPYVYKEAITATSTVNYTIPTGYSKMAAIVYGGAGNGQGSQYYDSTGGKGGGGASACAFQDYAVSATQVYTVTVGAAGGTSRITSPSAVVIAQATGGAQGGYGTGQNAGGTATSQVSGSVSINGGAGGGGIASGTATSQAGTNGSATSFTNLTAYGLTNPVAVALGGGAGGPYLTRPSWSQRYNSSGATTGGASGAAGVGGVAYTGTGSGIGGAGGGFVAGSGTTGSAGRVLIYVA